MIRANDMLGKAKTATYKPINFDRFSMYRDLPVFTFQRIVEMLRDPTVRLSLIMRSAPLQQAQFAYRDGDEWITGLRSENEEVGTFVLKQLRRFWRHELRKVLSAQVWGWSAGEVTYKLHNGRVCIDRSLHRHAADVFAVLRQGDIAGVKFTRLAADKGFVRLPVGKAYWHAYMPENESPYGCSVLEGAYSPWADKNLEGGACDVRRLFMHKDAYGGIDISYPAGSTPIGSDEVPNENIAREIAEQAKAGSITCRPSEVDPQTGKEMWTIDRATIPGNPQHILQYPKDLDLEITRGMGIPDEVILSQMTGAWQGKQVPMLAFFTSLDVWLADVVRTVTMQILEPLVMLNFGKAYEFEVSTKPLAEQAMEQMGEGDESAQPVPPQLQPFQQPPQQLSLGELSEQAIGAGVVNAAQIVQAGRDMLKHVKKPRRKKPPKVITSTPKPKAKKMSVEEAAKIAGLNASEIDILRGMV